MPTRAEMLQNLETLVSDLAFDPGLEAGVDLPDLQGGQAAARLMNEVLVDAIIATGVNNDGYISTGDMYTISTYVRARPALYNAFVAGHGDDEGNVETGFHLVQGDGGTLNFQGRRFINTVADAIYHFGFAIQDGRFRNEDGDANESAQDVAGWLNYFLNGENIVWGTGGNDTLTSGKYSDYFELAENEVFNGGNGNDEIWAGDGHDLVRGGNGNDTSGGGEGNDTLSGDAGNDKLFGDEGNDLVYGGAGDDELSGNEGHDRLSAGTGNDRLGGQTGNDLLYGGDGNDIVSGDNGHDQMYGDNGNDTMYGGEGRDRMSGGEGFDEMHGGLGDDVMVGVNGNDMMHGGDGDDYVYGGAGVDIVYGGAGVDRLYGGLHNDTVMGGDGTDYIHGGYGNDEMHGNDARDYISGSRGTDLIYGGAGSDRLGGNDDNDRIYGGDDGDLMWGGAGNDEMYGGTGGDIFYGGTGADKFFTWENDAEQLRDTFVILTGDTGVTAATRDTIEGFKSGIDKLDLRDFDLQGYIGNAEFYGNGVNQVRFAGGIVEIDSNGNGVADHSIEMIYLNSLQTSDFVL